MHFYCAILVMICVDEWELEWDRIGEGGNEGRVRPGNSLLSTQIVPFDRAAFLGNFLKKKQRDEHPFWT